MDDVAENADRIAVMHGGKKVMEGTPREIFRREEELEAIGLSIPAVTHIAKLLQKNGFGGDPDVLSMDEAVQSILSVRKA